MESYKEHLIINIEEQLSKELEEMETEDLELIADIGIEGLLEKLKALMK